MVNGILYWLLTLSKKGHAKGIGHDRTHKLLTLAGLGGEGWGVVRDR